MLPTAAGFAHEWEAQGMTEAIEQLIDGGRLKLYCPESNVSQSWTSKEASPQEKARRHRAYEAFIVEELVPWVRQDCASSSIRMAVSGASLGGYYAANFALKFPEVFHYALCMSGRYDITEFTDGVSYEPRSTSTTRSPSCPTSTASSSSACAAAPTSPWSAARARGRKVVSKRRSPWPTCWRPRRSLTSATSGATTSRTTGCGGSARRGYT